MTTKTLFFVMISIGALSSFAFMISMLEKGVINQRAKNEIYLAEKLEMETVAQRGCIEAGGVTEIYGRYGDTYCRDADGVLTLLYR